jgi:pyruvate carboxylase subunit B
VKYVVDIDGTRIEVELDGEIACVDGGSPQRARLMEGEGTPIRIVTIGDDSPQTHRVTARRDGARGRYVLRIDGWRHTVEALDERTRAIRDLSAAAQTSAGPRPLTAPMPGLVVRVLVAPGDQVEAGQSIVVMEAMKMENELRSPSAGRVKSVSAQAGAPVEKGAVLVEFDQGPEVPTDGNARRTRSGPV